MSTASNEGDRIPMSQGERDRLRVLHAVLEGQRTQVEAVRLLRLTPRHVHRLLQRLQTGGDAARSMACGASLPTTANRRHSAAVCCNSTARTTLTSAPRSQLRNWLSAAWRCPLIPCGAGCSPKACGNASAAGAAPQPPATPRLLRRIGADGHLDPRLDRGPRRGHGFNPHDR